MGLLTDNLLVRRRPTLLLTQLLGRATGIPATTLTKTSGGAASYDAGAFSTQALAGDGYVECVPNIASLSRGFGFSTSDTNQNFNTIGFLFLLDGGTTLAVYESGVSKYTGTYAVNDVLRVRRTGTTVTYEKNGVVLYTSLASSSGSIYVDTTLRHTAAVLSSMKLYDNGVRTPITWTNIVNVTVSVG